MRRLWIVAGLVTVVVAGAVGYRKSAHWKEYAPTQSSLMVNLDHADAVIRTESISKLPRDLLTVPIARDVLTEDLAFYYEQHEDKLGVAGAIKRIAYEHDLTWTDRLLSSVLDEPAEVGLWRDGKGALRHFAIVVERNAWIKVAQEALELADKDQQLKLAGEITTKNGKAKLFSLEVNPRRTLLFVAQGKRLVILSDPGLVFNRQNQVNGDAANAVARWLDEPGELAREFDLDKMTDPAAGKSRHTVAIGASTLAMGYGNFVAGFKGLRFDFGSGWSTHAWISPATLPAGGLADASLWRAAPANPATCVTMPMDWKLANSVVTLADTKPALPSDNALTPFKGPALACWYGESRLYAPVFLVRQAIPAKDRAAVLGAMAHWALTEPVPDTVTPGAGNVMVWRAAENAAPKTKASKKGEPARNSMDRELHAALAGNDEFVVFSPDGQLVELVLDTLRHRNPSVADQTASSASTLAVITPKRLAPMLEAEAIDSLKSGGDTSLLQIAQSQLPPRVKAFASYGPYRLELVGAVNAGSKDSVWQRVEWRDSRENKK